LVFEEKEEEKNDSYLSYLKGLDQLDNHREKLKKYQDLSDMANNFTGKLSLLEIHELVLKTIRNIIPKGEVYIASTSEESIFISWVRKQEVPLFVEDIERDYRFPTNIARNSRYKSIMVIPLWCEHKVYSFIEVVSEEINVYKEEDLRMIMILSDMASLAITNATLFNKKQELVIIDGLTDVFNRRYFLEIFDDELRRVKRYKLSLSLLLIDIDYFKAYNDSYGHLEGDKILRSVAKAFKDNVRETDVVARYGGEEFVILLSMACLDDAYHKAEQIRQIVEDKCRITISIGIVSTGKDATVDNLIAQADNALYKAKEQGRNKVVCAQN
ncbi:diguanylate cyclase, partial [bacterium]